MWFSLFLFALQEPLSSQQGFEELRAAIRPSGAETGFQEIAWLDRFGDGVRAAAEQDRPLLLWAMNGHPLGCT